MSSPISKTGHGSTVEVWGTDAYRDGSIHLLLRAEVTSDPPEIYRSVSGAVRPGRTVDTRPDIPPPEGRADGEWISLRAAKKRLPGVHRQTLLRHAPSVRPGDGYLGERSVYVWIDEATVNLLTTHARSLPDSAP